MKRPLLFMLVAAALLVAAWVLPVVEWLQAAITWIEANRGISWLVFIVLYIVATVLLLPGSLLTLGAGFVFGLAYGFALVSLSSVVGASLAFLIGRFLARDWVAEKLQGMPRFAALDAAIAERGALIVLLTRLSPVFPFNLLNYALGLTGVQFWTYALVSWVGMVPGTLLYVYIGSIAGDLANLFAGSGEASPLGSWPLYVGLVATLVLTIVISRIATRALREQLPEEPGMAEAET